MIHNCLKVVQKALKSELEQLRKNITRGIKKLIKSDMKRVKKIN